MKSSSRTVARPTPRAGKSSSGPAANLDGYHLAKLVSAGPGGTGASDHAHRRFYLETRFGKSFGRRRSGAKRHQSASTANDEHPFTLLRKKPSTLRYLMLSAGTFRRPSALPSVRRQS